MGNIDKLIEVTKKPEVRDSIKDAWFVAKALGVVIGGVTAFVWKFTDRTVKIPEIHLGETHTMLLNAEKTFGELGLKVFPQEAYPSTAYVNCYDSEVVATIPKPGTRVLPGSAVTLFYVTSDVIDRSRKLALDAEEKEKEELRNKEIEAEQITDRSDDRKFNIKKLFGRRDKEDV